VHVHSAPNHEGRISVTFTTAERSWLAAWIEAAIAADRDANKIRDAKLGQSVLKKLRQA
jgi:hypothetical protein